MRRARRRFVKISEHYFGCATARNKGTCTNLTAIKREVLEETVLGGLQDHLMDPALIGVFCTEHTRHLNRLRSDALASTESIMAGSDGLNVFSFVAPS